MTDGDLIRRGDAVGVCRAVGAEGPAYSIDRLPADPVATAASSLAEAIRIACSAGCVSLCFNGNCDTITCRAVFEALGNYRAAVEAAR